VGQDLRFRVILGHNENDYHIQSDVIVFIAAVFELWGATIALTATPLQLTNEEPWPISM